VPVETRPTSARQTWRSLALPSEHGGWGLTLEPVLLGLLVAPSVAGACLGVAAVLAFLVRTPLKLTLVDRRRGRHLERTTLATRVAACELAAIVVLASTATWLAGPGWWLVVVAAAPLVGLELWFDVRSRSRRLVPELAGAVGISAASAAIVVAAGQPTILAVALWLVLAGRVSTSIPYVRDQVARLHGRDPDARIVVAGDVAALLLVGGAALVDGAAALGALAVLVVVVAQRVEAARLPAPRAVVLGIRQTVVGLVVVLATAAGTWAA
jgi:hypothetical protein